MYRSYHLNSSFYVHYHEKVRFACELIVNFTNSTISFFSFNLADPTNALLEHCNSVKDYSEKAIKRAEAAAKKAFLLVFST
jgi:hypothetical protein